MGVDQQQALCNEAARRSGGGGGGGGGGERAGERGAHWGNGGTGASDVVLASDVALLIDALLHITT